MDSLDTQKGMRHCVLRESKTLFKPEDVEDPKPLIQPRGFIQINELEITSYDYFIWSRAGDEITFDIKAKTFGTKKVNIYFLVERSAALEDIFGTISNNIDEMCIESERFPGSKIGIGEFADIPYFPFVQVPSVEDEEK
ncbi:hypothetical protein RF11_04349 [Thelohanellus kitauei]|uniref:Uncharacterized protein n=1 Tax=Thelohanellus kitauei TaxID=669202 RepID=A0A0C2J3V7_THEKT|nr:hypothetical protein RF11_04349 [Thelohanellus kitauei]